MRSFAVTIPLFFFATGCLSGTEALVADVKPEGWTESIYWKYPNADTLTLRDISFTLRHSAGIEPLENLYIVEVYSPSGRRQETPVRITVDPAATQASRLQETGEVLLTGARFDEQGEWRFIVTPMQPTVGVWSVAIELNKTQRNGQR